MARQEFPTSAASPSLFVYAAAYVLTAIAMTVLAYALPHFTGFDLPGGASAAIPTLAGAAYAAQRYVARHDAMPTKGAAWTFAFAAAAVTAAINAANLGLIYLVAPELLAVLADFAGIVAIVALFFLLLVLLGIRFMIRSFAKGQLKANARRAARA